jgi:hypothetical protein
MMLQYMYTGMPNNPCACACACACHGRCALRLTRQGSRVCALALCT